MWSSLADKDDQYGAQVVFCNLLSPDLLLTIRSLFQVLRFCGPSEREVILRRFLDHISRIDVRWLSNAETSSWIGSEEKERYGMRAEQGQSHQQPSVRRQRDECTLSGCASSVRTSFSTTPTRRTICAVVCLVLFFLSSASCSRLQLPAIDPNGSSVFLPLPNTTQLNVPRLHSRNGQAGIIPNPAFQTPATPPPCLDGGVCNLYGNQHRLYDKLQGHFDSRGDTGEIQVTPRLVVAPVGGEVVLLAGHLRARRIPSEARAA